ncbi:MAG: hypothetical protein ACRD1T_19215, partial [Acidimicrobiia bacterium]
ISTGMGEARNILIVRNADALIAVGGGYGTLSEIALAPLAPLAPLALKMSKPVVGIGTWELSISGADDEAILRAREAREAVKMAIEALQG